MAPVATQQQHSSLTRTMRVGDEFSIDNGRVRVKLEGWQGRRAVVNFHIDRELKVDKPPKSGS